MKNKFGKLALLAILLIAFVVVFNFAKIKKLYHTIRLFDEDVIVQNFQNMDSKYPTTKLTKSKNPLILPSDLKYTPIESFKFKDSIFSFDKYLEATRTEGLLIIHKDTIIHEQYSNDLEQNESHISWSMSKSFIAAMMGIAYDKGMYQLDDKITDHLPQFKDTGYDNVEIEDILQMSSGIGFNEDYGDFNSDINKFGRAFATGSSLEEFARSLKRAKEPGSFFHYVSLDTQVLGILLIKLTGKNLTELTQQWLWNSIGMEHDGEWIVDNNNLELALGGLNASLRDFSKLGLLYLNDGKLNGKQIVSKNWIEKSLNISEDHLQPDQLTHSSNHHGYGYQWWIPQKDDGDYFMVGIYNQFVYIQPKKDLIIAKLSANHHFKTEGSITKDIHLAMFKTMASKFEDVLTEVTE